MSQSVPQITRERMAQALNSVYAKRDFQMMLTVMTHAQTCKQCSKRFLESLKEAKDHLESELR